jgi:hypothetical protein
MAEYIADIVSPDEVEDSLEEEGKLVPEEDLEQLEDFVKNQLPVHCKDLIFTKSTLTRWDLGRGGSVERAKRGIRKHISWRLENAVDEITQKSVEEEIARNICFLAGPDKEGRPALFIFVRRHVTAEVDPDAMTDFIIFVMEQCVQKCVQTGVEEAISIVFDLHGFSLGNNMDYKTLFEFVKTLQYNYPCIVHRCYIANAPWLFNAVYTGFIRPFLSQEARELVTFLKTPEELEEVIDADLIPSDYFESDDEEEEEEEEEEGEDGEEEDEDGEEDGEEEEEEEEEEEKEDKG